VNYQDLAPIVAIDVMGAPNPLIVRKIAEAANEFFRLTRAYEVTTAPTSITANTKVVALTPPTGTDFLEINEVWLGGTRLYPPANLRLPDGWEQTTGRPERYVPQGPAIRLHPYPIENLVDQVVIKYAVVPKLTAISIPDEVGVEYQDALIEGAKARLLAMPRKDWADRQAAGDARSLFVMRVNETRLKVRNKGSSEVQYRVVSRFV
jgi:hypothetical protein